MNCLCSYQRQESIQNLWTWQQSKTNTLSIINPQPMHIATILTNTHSIIKKSMLIATDFLWVGLSSPKTFTFHSMPPTLSFCAEPNGEVAESIIDKITFSLGRRCPPGRMRGGGKISSPALSHHLRRPHLSRKARAIFSMMDSATSPSAPRRMTGVRGGMR